MSPERLVQRMLTCRAQRGMRSVSALMLGLVGALPLFGWGCEAGEGRGGHARSPGAGALDSGSAPPKRSPSHQGTDPRAPLDPLGDLCTNLCAARGSCFETYFQVALDPPEQLVVTRPGEPCLDRCRQARRDLLIDDLFRRQSERCLLPRLSLPSTAIECDAFLGCAVRHRLLWLEEEPWRLTALGARSLVTKVKGRAAAKDPEGAVGLCVEGKQLRARLELLAREPGPDGASPSAPTGKSAVKAMGKAILAELAALCQAAKAAAVETLARSIEASLAELRLEVASAACRRLGDLAELPGAPETQGARLAEASRACETVEPLRAVATAVADAEADSALVSRELGRAEGSASAYHKCVHKIATLGTLEASPHPRARAAAKTLRAACFERFPVEWLREIQRRRDPADRALCFRVRLVTRLLLDPGASPAFKAQTQALAKWALAQCP